MIRYAENHEEDDIPAEEYVGTNPGEVCSSSRNKKLSTKSKDAR